MTPKLPIRDCLEFGWSILIKRPMVYIGAVALVNASWLLSEYLDDILSLPHHAGEMAVMFILGLLSAAIYVVVMTDFMLRAHDAPDAVSFNDIFHPRHFLKLVGVVVLVGIFVFLGLLAIIVPGLILMALLTLAPYPAIDKGFRPWAAIKESVRLSKGNRFKIFILGMLTLASSIPLAIVSLFAPDAVANIVRCLFDFVVLPVTGIALAHAYRLLDRPEEPTQQG